MPNRRVIPRAEKGDLVHTLRDYLGNRSLRERSEYHEGKLKKELLSHLETEGALQEGGHRIIELDEPEEYFAVKEGKPIPKLVNGIERKRRVSQSLNEDRTLAMLKEKGLLDQCTEVIVVLNEDAILAANYAGDIEDEELVELYDENESFAFYLITEDA
jgi:hypothetical protein